MPWLLSVWLTDDDGLRVELEDVVRALRQPNLVVEPRLERALPVVEEGFRARPRQLVRQPAGPGVATGDRLMVDGYLGIVTVSNG